MPPQPPELKNNDLSALYISARDLSKRGQDATKRAVRVELSSLILAGGAGVTSWRLGAWQLDVLAAAAAFFFLLSLTSAGLRAYNKPERDWYQGRAVAESIKTSAWRFAVGGNPYSLALGDAGATTLYLERLREILRQVEDLPFGATPLDAHEVSDRMLELRHSDLDVRRASYKRFRIEDQIAWYQDKAKVHRWRANLWLGVTIGASVAGVVAAGVKFFGGVDVDLLGVAAAVASAAIAWNQLSQNRVLVSAYTVTARELNIIRSSMDVTDEADWPQFVSDAEDAVSREHTMWAARHGHPVRLG